MEAVAIIVVLASFAVGVYGIINIIKPLGFLRIRKRWHGLVVLGSSCFTFLLGGLLGAAGQPGGLSAAPAEASAKAAESGAPALAAAKKPAGVTQAEFDGMWRQVKGSMESCDASLRRAGEVVGAGNAYNSFGPVKAAGETCKAVWLGMDRIEIPRSAKGDVKKALSDARDTCSTAAYLKTEAMEQMAKVLDGDARPSVMADLQDKMQRGGDLSSGCFVEFLGAAGKAGLTLPELTEAFDQAKGKAEE